MHIHNTVDTIINTHAVTNSSWGSYAPQEGLIAAGDCTAAEISSVFLRREVTTYHVAHDM